MFAFIYSNMRIFVDIGLRLIVACVLGGIIGLQRESVGRPAGLRTHILVSISSALVMITSEAMFRQYGSHMDPARLGAQVVSGIGFLGAGTIIRDGVTIKGLTTAASLWSVACIGLAVGGGMYWAAFFTTLLIYITLYTFKRIGDYVDRIRHNGCIAVSTNNDTQIAKAIEDILSQYNVHIYKVDFNKTEDNLVLMRFQIRYRKVEDRTDIMAQIAQLGGILSVKEE